MASWAPRKTPTGAMLVWVLALLAQAWPVAEGSTLPLLEPDTVLYRDWQQADWISGRMQQTKCVDIPSNLTLCQGIGYQRMRLPNLLDHDSLAEVTQQASSWVPLINIRCHPDTGLFLCSLFSPVCLDRLIYPCRSLCENVKEVCEVRMQTYGFDWPEMLKCEKFPVDNDLCIQQQNRIERFDVDGDNGSFDGVAYYDKNCTECKHPLTFEAIIDSYCRSEFALRVRVDEIKQEPHLKRLILKKRKKPLKKMDISRRDLRKAEFVIKDNRECECDTLHSNDRLLVMGKKEGDVFVVTFVQRWMRQFPHFKKAIKAMRKGDMCEGIFKDLTKVEVGKGPGSDSRKRKGDKKRKGGKKGKKRRKGRKRKKGKKGKKRKKKGRKNRKGRKNKNKSKGTKKKKTSMEEATNTVTSNSVVS